MCVDSCTTSHLKPKLRAYARRRHEHTSDAPAYTLCFNRVAYEAKNVLRLTETDFSCMHRTAVRKASCCVESCNVGKICIQRWLKLVVVY